ncbi:response regulator [Pseudomonas sp. NY15437]|uniref:response regulator n=1 Tax=Pseudomonas sp. NY15437 TaxID=3400360 RepID=UPI003A865CAF
MPRIVFVEPSGPDFLALRRHLRAGGFKETLHLKHAQQALRQLKAGECDLLVVTLDLPDIHGLELIVMLRQRGQLDPATPVMVCSHRNTSLSIHQAVRVGISGFILLGDRLPLLGGAIETLLAGGSVLPEHPPLCAEDDPRLGIAREFSSHQIAVLHGFNRGHSASSLAEIFDLPGTAIDQCKGRLMRKMSASSLDELLCICENIGLL